MPLYEINSPSAHIWNISHEFFLAMDMADTLQHINLKVVDHEKCKEIYIRRGSNISEQSQLCAGGESGRDSCVGDSGSSMVVSEVRPGQFFSSWKLVGLVSFGPQECGTENIPGVYSRIRHYLDWIIDVVTS